MSYGLFSLGYPGQRWGLMDAGPGGNIIGINYSNDGTAVVRTDTGGAYVNTVANPVWQELITVGSMPAGEAAIMGGYATGGVTFDGTYAAAVAPSNSNVIYLFTINGKIFVSTNRGVTFSSTGFTPVTIAVNGQSDNNFNERLAIDPQNPAFVIAGCASGVFYNTTTGSGAWTKITSVGTGTKTSLAAIDPSSSVVGGLHQTIYVSTYGTGVYRSTTGPSGTFTLLNSTGMPTAVSQLKVSSDGTLYAVNNDGTSNIYRYSGGVWTSCDTMTGAGYNTSSDGFLVDILVDPANSSRVVATFEFGDLSESYDHGTTWTGKTPGPITRVASDVPWLASCNHPKFAGCTGAFNPALTNTIAVTEGLSVWTTNPFPLTSSSSYTIGATGNTTYAVSSVQNVGAISVGDPVLFYSSANGANNAYGFVVSYTPINATSGTLVVNMGGGNGTGAHTDWKIRVGAHWTSQGAGINQLVNNWMVVPPGGKPFVTAWDRCGLYLGSPTTFPANQAFGSPGGLVEIIAGWDVDYSASTPTYLAGIFNSNITTKDISGYSTDGGQTWTSFSASTASNPSAGGLNISGSIAVATTSGSTPATQNIVWCPSYRGGGANNPYYSTDGGATWALSSFPAGVPTTVPTGWGSYNTTPGLKRFAADRVANNTFYAYNDVTASVYRSIDGGASFQLRSSAVTTSGAVLLKSVPKLGATDTTGWLFGFAISDGTQSGKTDIMVRSKNGGTTWSTVDTGFTTVAAVGFGASVNGAVPAVLVVAIKSGVRGVFLSTDDCATWKNVTQGFGSADQIADCEGDKTTPGIWYVTTKNTGIYQATAVA